MAIKDCRPGDCFWLCSDWEDASEDFEEVRIVERRHTRLAVKWLTGPRAGAVASVYAHELCPADRVEAIRALRVRDLRIDALTAERRNDLVTRTAIDLCCALAFGTGWEQPRFGYFLPEDVRALLRRLGRPDDLSEVHELAFAWSEHSEVRAPDRAWQELFAAFAAAERSLVAQRLQEVAETLDAPEPTARAAIAMVRRWSGLPNGNDGTRTPSTSGNAGEIARLQALVELAAEALDEAGRPDQALRIRKAAFPHRFKSSSP